MDLSHVREQYETTGLVEADVDPDPIVQFQRWYREAEAAELWEPNAMVVSVVDDDGWPTSRFVLLKAVDHDGFVFYTNLESDKGRALDARGRAALTFGWLPLRRQVRVHGRVERVSDAEADTYYASRPRGSRIGAWASPQSRVVSGRAELDERYEAAALGFTGDDIPRPPHWGGYRVVPSMIEFWQGRPDRFHDRIRFRLDAPATAGRAATGASPLGATATGGGSGRWLMERLAP